MDSRTQYLKQLEQQWENLTITNDIMFGMVMENEQICLELIQRSLPELNIKSISKVIPQKQINGPISSRTIRVDIFVRDDCQRTFAIEMQVANRHNLPFRLRYYQQQIDFDILNVGDSYEKLGGYPTYVIMFCDFDYFGFGWSKYEFENRCLDNPELKLGDKRRIIIFNAKATKFHGSMRLRGFLQLMENTVDEKDQFVSDIQAEMKRIREDPIRRHGFMKYELDLMDARSEGHKAGVEEGKQTGKIEGTIDTLQQLGYSQAQIIAEVEKTYGISKAQIMNLLDGLSK